MIPKHSKIVITGLLFVLLLTALPLFAQVKAFTYKASLQKIDSGGVYKIELSPDVIAKSQPGLVDLRLADNTGKFVAYALSTNITVENKDSFVAFPPVGSGGRTDTVTVYIAENTHKLSIGQLWLKLKNTDVSRYVNLAGSDDLQQWFAIKEDISLRDAGEGHEAEYEQSLSFPTSNYRYFKIQVYGRNKTPVKIVQAGIYTASLNKPEFTALPQIKFDTKDTGKISHLNIQLNEPYLVNKLHLSISSPKFYSRRVIVYAIAKDFKVDGEQLCDTTLTSVGTQDMIFSAKSGRLRVDIYNGDDNPLTITAVTAYQLKQYAVSYLEGGHDYFIFTGDSVAAAVNYDLSFLKYRAFNLLPIINHASLAKNQDYAIATPTVKPNFTPLLWAAIALVLVLLSFLTLKMLREIKATAK